MHKCTCTSVTCVHAPCIVYWAHAQVERIGCLMANDTFGFLGDLHAVRCMLKKYLAALLAYTPKLFLSCHDMTCCCTVRQCCGALQIATDLTVNQTDDILWIRRLFYRKLGQLARHRKALLSQMNQSQVDTCHASEKLTGLTDWGQRLHQNGLDEYCTWLQFALCLMRGVTLWSSWSSHHV